MTITEKWELMLNSFADIKAAIEEKGGTLDGYYNGYANGVRSIYGGEGQTVTEYPEHTSMYFTYIFSQVLFCAACKEQIRQAIIDGGVECGAAVPLSEYGNKIREIETEPEPIEIPSQTIKVMQGQDNTVTVTASGGVPPYTWENTDGTISAWWGLTLSTEGIITGTPNDNYAGILVNGVEMRVTDSAGNTAEGAIAISVKKKRS